MDSPKQLQHLPPDFDNQPGWKTTESLIVHPGPYVDLRIEKFTSPTRPEPFPWTVAHRKGGSMLVPITAHGKFVMLRQERVPIKKSLWEFPAGQIDAPEPITEKTIKETALRELQEETGYELLSNGQFIPLGHYFSSPGFTDEHCFLSMATPVTPTLEGKKPDAAESITDIREFSLDEIKQMIATGEIQDANSLCAFARLIALDIFK